MTAKTIRVSLAGAALLGCLASAAAGSELWVAPTSQKDLGGLGVATANIWPTTPTGAVRFAWAIPDDLETFQSAKLVLIPQASTQSATLNVSVCAAKSSDGITNNCVGPLTRGFASIASQLLEIDISTLIAPRIGSAGATYLAVLASTSTAATDRIVGLRFDYGPAPQPTVALLGANTFTGPQTAPAFIGSGVNLTGVAKLTANTFTGTQIAPQFNVIGKLGIGTTNPLGTLQIGPNTDALFRIEPAPFSPFAGVIRFGDGTGWRLAFGKSRVGSGGPLAKNDEELLMSLSDSGDLSVLGDLQGGNFSFQWDTFANLPGLLAVEGTGSPFVGFRIGGRDAAYIDSGGVYHSLSSRAVKHRFRAIDFADTLARIERLPIMEWSYQDQDAAIRHIGPFAEDFHELFGLGGDDNTRISSVDPSGVALAGVKALAERVRTRERDLEAQREQLQRQAAQIEALNALLRSRH